MENLGPTPVRTSELPTPLSPQRAALLEHLQSLTTPASAAQLASRSGHHVNTVRQHLESLHNEGLVSRVRAPANSRGRPPWLYQANPMHAEHDPRVREYAALAGVLCARLSAAGASASHESLLAGEEWARTIAGQSQSQLTGDRPTAGHVPVAVDHLAARRAVVQVLTELGFAPEYDNQIRQVRLRRCPLLDVARRYPDVVCQVHLGLVRGLMRERGAKHDSLELSPFSEVGACLLEWPTQ